MISPKTIFLISFASLNAFASVKPSTPFAQKPYAELIQIAFDSKSDYQKRWTALTLASQMRGHKSIADLERAARSKEWFMRNAALISLQKISNEKAKVLALKLLKDDSLVVRSAAVLALPEKISVNEREALWQELSAKYNYRGNQSLWIRAQIIEQLAKNPEKKELILFVKSLSDKDQRLVGPALMALDKIAPEARINQTASLETRKKSRLAWARAQGLSLQ